MEPVKTSEAAALLNVSPNTLRAWERRFGYPKPKRTPGKQRLYDPRELAALRDGLQDGLSISGAIARAHEATSRDQNRLANALSSYDAAAADRVMQGVLAMRSVDYAVSQELLPALEALAEQCARTSTAWGFADAWARDWLSRARRLTPEPSGPRVLLLVGEDLSLSAVRAHALRLTLVREDMRVLLLPASSRDDDADFVERFPPEAIVLAGLVSRADHETWHRWVRTNAAGAPIVSYDAPPPSPDDRPVARRRLPQDVTDAAWVIEALLGRTLPSDEREPAAS